MTYTEEEVYELIRHTLVKASNYARGNYAENTEIVYNDYDDAFADGLAEGRVMASELIDQINPRDVLDNYGKSE